MADTKVLYQGDGFTRQFNVPFPFISRDHVLVEINTIVQLTPANYRWIDDVSVEFTVAPPSGAAIEISRATPDEVRLVQFQNGAVLTEDDLELSAEQLFFLIQESKQEYQELIENAILKIATGNGIEGTTPEEILDNLAAEIIGSDTTADLIQAINDIDTLGDLVTAAQAVADQAAADVAQARQDIDSNLQAIEGLLIDVGDANTLIDSVNTNLQAQIDAIAQLQGADVFLQPEPPVPGVGGVPDPILSGSRWYDTDDGNRSYIWSGTQWLDTTDPRIADNENAIIALNAAIEDPVTGLQANSTALLLLDSTVFNLDGVVQANSLALQNLGATINDPVTGLSAVGGLVNTLQVDLQQNTDDITLLVQDVSELTGRVTTAEGGVSANFQAIGGLQGTINQIGDDISAVVGRVDSLEAVVYNATTGVSATASGLSALQLTVSELSDDVTAGATQLTNLTAEVELKTRTWFSPTAPRLPPNSGDLAAEGDLWVDTDAGNALHRCNRYPDPAQYPPIGVPGSSVLMRPVAFDETVAGGPNPTPLEIAPDRVAMWDTAGALITNARLPMAWSDVRFFGVDGDNVPRNIGSEIRTWMKVWMPPGTSIVMHLDFDRFAVYEFLRFVTPEGSDADNDVVMEIRYVTGLGQLNSSAFGPTPGFIGLSVLPAQEVGRLQWDPIRDAGIAANASATESLRVLIEDNDTGLSALAQDITSLSADLTTANDNVATAQQTIDNLSLVVNDEVTGLMAVNSQVTALSASLEDLEDTVNVVQAGAIQQLQTTVSDQGDLITTNANAITDLQVSAGARTYITPSPPANDGSLRAGDLWFDSDDSNQLYRWNGTAWQPVRDGLLTANVGATQQLQSDLVVERGRITANADDITTLQVDVTTALGDSAEALNQVANVASAVFEPNGTTTVWSTQITNLSAQVGDVEDLAASKNKIIYAEQFPGAANLDLNDLFVRLSDAKVFLFNGSGWTPLTATDPLATAASEAVSTLDTEVQRIDGEVIATAARVDTLESLAFDPVTGLSAVNSAIDLLQTETSTNADGIQANADAITALDTILQNPLAGTGALATALNSLSTDITANALDIASFSGDITELTGRVTTVEGVADSKADIYYSPNPPNFPPAKVGDLWWKSSNTNNQLGEWHRLGVGVNGEVWIPTREAALDANTSAISSLTQQINDSETGLVATANQLTALESDVAVKTRTFFQAVAPVATAVGDLWVDSDNDNRIYRWNGSTWAEVTDLRTAGNATAINNLTTRVEEAEGEIIRVESDLTTQLGVTQTNLSGQIGAAQLTINANVAAIEDLEARYGVTLNVNGYVTGFAQNNDGQSGSFIVTADRFAIVQPNTPAGSPGAIPFAVEGGQVVINNALINNLSVGKLSSGSLGANVNLTGTFSNGQTAFDTGTGFWLGVDAGTPKFSIGNSAGDKLVWNGTSLVVEGDLRVRELNVDKLTGGNLTADIVQDGTWEVGNGTIVFDNGVFIRALGVGFGTTNQFLEWFGPRPAGGNLSLCTEANAVQYLKTNGDAYFGGTLSAGILRNSARGTSTASNAETIVGPFTTNGSPKQISYSYALANQRTWFNSNENFTPIANPSATIVLERRLGTGSWSVIRTETINGTFTYEPAGAEQGFYRLDIAGSFSFTDTNTSTQDHSYRLRITTRNATVNTSSGSLVTQDMTVISTEE